MSGASGRGSRRVRIRPDRVPESGTRPPSADTLERAAEDLPSPPSGSSLGPPLERRSGRVGAPPPVAVLAAGLLATLMAALGGYLLYDRAARVTVSVNGEVIKVGRGTTIARLAARRELLPLAGDLLSVSGRVLRVGGGRPAKLSLAGRPLPADRVLARGERLLAARGDDTTESAQRVERTIEATETVVEGDGPFYTVARPFIDGLEVDAVGSISGEVVRKRLEREPMGQALARRDGTAAGQVVALTFDDGPHPMWTPRFVAALEREDAKATFFQLGTWIRRYPKVTRAVADGGHEIGNHSSYHWNWDKVSEKEIDQEVRWCEDAAHGAAGVRPAWLRPPGGRLNQKVFRVAGRLKMPIVMWDVDTGDWRRPSARAIVDRAVSGARPGAVILMHDGGGDRSATLAAVPGIVAGLRSRGYRLVTVSELYSMSGG